MDHIVKNLENAYSNLVTAASNVLEAKEVSDFERSKNSDDALERFYNTLQLFHAACDQTQEFVEYLRLRIGSECLVDEATGPLTAKISKPGQDGAENRVAIPSLSALRLEQMSKAVRWLVIELQQGAASATPRPDDTSGALDIRPEDDAHQHLSGLFYKDTPLPSLAETTRFLGGENTDEWASTAEGYTLSEVTATVGCSSSTVAQHILIADDNTPAAAGLGMYYMRLRCKLDSNALSNSILEELQDTTCIDSRSG